MSMKVARKTQSSTSWRPIINGTKANVVLEKHTVQYNIQKNIQAKRKQEAKSAKRKLKWRTTAMRVSRTNINDKVKRFLHHSSFASVNFFRA